MNFDLSPDEVALQQAIRELCARRFPIERTRETGLDAEDWRALEESGVPSLRAPEPGGLGLGMTEAVVVFEELGRGLVPGPIVATHLARTIGAPVDVATVMERGEPLVEHLDAAQTVVVLDDEGAWLVAASEIDAARAEPLDPMTPVHRIESLPQGERIGDAQTPRALRREGAALHAAMNAGIAARLTEMAVEYAKQRQQFGRAIGSFQAVKHICADMLVRAEVARAAVYAAGCVLDDARSGDPARAVASAKVVASDAAIANGKACVQVHGGMGFTWEVPVHLYLKRALVLASAFSADGGELALAATV